MPRFIIDVESPPRHMRSTAMTRAEHATRVRNKITTGNIPLKLRWTLGTVRIENASGPDQSHSIVARLGRVLLHVVIKAICGRRCP